MRKFMIAFIIAFVMCVCGLVLSILFTSCHSDYNESFRKDIIGHWLCIGHDKAQEQFAFCGLTFDWNNKIEMVVGEDTYYGRYEWVNNQISCDFINGEEHTDIYVKDIFVDSVEKHLTNWKIYFDLYFDDEFYMEFEGMRIEKSTNN